MIRMRKESCRLAAALCLALSGAAALTGCVVYETPPAYQPTPSKFDQSWNAALGAAGDTGMRITTADQARGLIQGKLGNSEMTIGIRPQADGSVRVEINARGPGGQDEGAARSFSDAYNRRMGR